MCNTCGPRRRRGGSSLARRELRGRDPPRGEALQTHSLQRGAAERAHHAQVRIPGPAQVTVGPGGGAGHLCAHRRRLHGHVHRWGLGCSAPAPAAWPTALRACAGGGSLCWAPAAMLRSRPVWSQSHPCVIPASPMCGPSLTHAHAGQAARPRGAMLPCADPLGPCCGAARPLAHRMRAVCLRGDELLPKHVPWLWTARHGSPRSKAAASPAAAADDGGQRCTCLHFTDLLWCTGCPFVPLSCGFTLSFAPAAPPSSAAASALAALQAKRDSIQKRTESLIRLKNEFQDLSRVL